MIGYNKKYYANEAVSFCKLLQVIVYFCDFFATYLLQHLFYFTCVHDLRCQFLFISIKARLTGEGQLFKLIYIDVQCPRCLMLMQKIYCCFYSECLLQTVDTNDCFY